MFPIPGLAITSILAAIHRFKHFLGMVACGVHSGFCACQVLWSRKMAPSKQSQMGIRGHDLPRRHQPRTCLVDIFFCRGN